MHAFFPPLIFCKLTFVGPKSICLVKSGSKSANYQICIPIFCAHKSDWISKIIGMKKLHAQKIANAKLQAQF